MLLRPTFSPALQPLSGSALIALGGPGVAMITVVSVGAVPEGVWLPVLEQLS